MTGSENVTCKLLPQEMAFKERSPLLEKIPRRGERRMGDHCDGFSVWVCYEMQGGGGNWLSSISFLATEGMNWFTGKVLGGFFGGVENKGSVCNLMPSGGSQLAFRALRFQCATDQKLAWSVSRQNTHRNHFKEAWIMHEARRSCSGLTVLTCHRWAVHRISGGLVVPSCCVAGGCVSWAAERRGDWKQTRISGLGCSAHRE